MGHSNFSKEFIKLAMASSLGNVQTVSNEKEGITFMSEKMG